MIVVFNFEMNAFNASRSSISRYTSQNAQQQFGNMKRNLKKMRYDLKCDHCKTKGHSIDQCFKLIGYPEWWSNAKGKSIFSSSKMAANVGSVGIFGSGPHDSTECSTATGNLNVVASGVDPVMVNRVYHEVVKMMKSKGDYADSELDNPLASSVDFAGISQSNGFQFNSMNCIINTGASDHMACSLALFDSINPLLGSCLNVKLPDGCFVLVIYSGTVKINSLITLFDVLYIPNFKHNLLSVRKLLLTHNLLAHFERDFFCLSGPCN